MKISELQKIMTKENEYIIGKAICHIRELSRALLEQADEIMKLKERIHKAAVCLEENKKHFENKGKK